MVFHYSLDAELVAVRIGPQFAARQGFKLKLSQRGDAIPGADRALVDSQGSGQRHLGTEVLDGLLFGHRHIMELTK